MDGPGGPAIRQRFGWTDRRHPAERGYISEAISSSKEGPASGLNKIETVRGRDRADRGILRTLRLGRFRNGTLVANGGL
jgi:hypothetical protein